MTDDRRGPADARAWLAVVPMKRHSARVPGKNIRHLHGRPLYHWVFDALSNVDAIDRIVLDTDDEKIAAMVSCDFDVEVSIRPASLRGDCVSTNALLAHVLATHSGRDRFLQTHATNPLLTSKTIAGAIQAFEQDVAHDSLFTVTRLQTRLYDQNGGPMNHDPRQLVRTQDLPPVFEENSNLYVFTRGSFEATGSRIGRKPKMFEMSALEALDIDEEEDFTLAGALLATFAVDRAAAV